MEQRPIPLVVLALVGALGTWSSCSEPDTAPARERLQQLGKERVQELDPRTTDVGRRVPDVAFTDVDGRAGKLSDFVSGPLVIAMRDLGCPVSQRTAPALARVEDAFAPRGVAFLFVDVNDSDEPEALRADQASFGFAGRVVRDLDATLARTLGATTTTEFFVLDPSRTLVYRGAIDDQAGRGVARDEPQQHYLVEALEATLARQKVLIPATSAPGCVLGLEPLVQDRTTPTYHHEVARILRDNCVECHRPGGVAPFGLETYAKARAKKAMVELVVEDGVMPPWFAAPDTGPWKNDRRLSPADKETLLAWIAAGAPEGDERETPRAYVYPDGWRIGEPDLVFRMKERFEVPAEGLVTTRYFEVEPEVPADLWIQRLEIRPEARAVVHHVTVSYQAPAVANDPERALRQKLLPFAQSVNDGWVFLFGYLPGKGPRSYPEGIARFLPKGAKLRFDMHYTPNGKAIPDQTSLGLVLAKQPPELVAESRNFWNRDIAIPPHASHVVFTKEYPIQHDVLLRSLTPHMHLRGRSMVAELIRPDESREKLIDIPSWDQNWQFNYVFREPRFTPAGSRVRVTATYDNSSDNPANPDPNVWVKDGPQTNDEMMSLVVEWIRPRLWE